MLIAASVLFLALSVGALVLEWMGPDTALGRLARAALDASLLPWVNGRAGAWISIGCKAVFMLILFGAAVTRGRRMLFRRVVGVSEVKDARNGSS